MSEKRAFVPDREIYHQTLKKLIENSNIITLIAVRLGCEMGLSRLEIVNARNSDIDRINKRGLWIETAKRVRRGSHIVKHGKGVTKVPVFEMRQREIPINSNLYQLLKTYSTGQKYILHREKGDMTKPFIPRYINSLYEEAGIPWSSHKSRHYFKGMVWAWMIKNRTPDPGLLKEFMGHEKSTDESYGVYPWDYKLEVLDKVFE